MENLGYRVLTAQNGPEVLYLERAVSRFTDLVMAHGISGGEAGVGLFGKNVAGRRRPAERSVGDSAAAIGHVGATQRGYCVQRHASHC